jgi:TonB family protein
VVNIEYPLLALQSRTEGSLTVECLIASDGSVSSAKLLAGSPPLGSAVLSRIGEWRFRLISEKSPEPSRITMTFTFALERSVVQQPKVKFIYDFPYDVTVISQPVRRTH